MLQKIIRKWKKRNLSPSQAYVQYLREIGCRVGEDVNVFDPASTVIDDTRPWLIEIGNHVGITHGVTILTHGYDWAVLKTVYGDVLGSAGKVTIGDNVFIGMNTTILKGVHIGSNVIIGAGSLVSRDIPDNCVAAGNPCRVLMSLEDYYAKRKQAQLQEAAELVRSYRERYGREPDETILREFYWLFSDDPETLCDAFRQVQDLCENRAYSDRKLKEHTKQFADMAEFLASIE